ncbi:hypothetical protein [Azospirillum sp. B2RO_4]|uniref:hypothetical protein n=1 Tax=Azospirillum sp. B2RO_4 TaxID=3027796 RepID=UPI003DA94810
MTTIDLTKLATDAVAKYVEDGSFQKMLEKGIKGALESVINDATGYGSPFRKEMADAVKGALHIRADALNLPAYNQTVIGIIRNRLDEVVNEQLRDKLQKDLDALLVDAPKEITLTKLVKDFKVWLRKEKFHSDSACTVIVEKTEYGSHWIKLDPKKYQQSYSCQFRIGIDSDGEVFSLSDSGVDMQKAVLSKTLIGFPRDLFQLMAAGTKIVIDSMDIDDSMESYEDDEEEDI